MHDVNEGMKTEINGLRDRVNVLEKEIERAEERAKERALLINERLIAEEDLSLALHASDREHNVSISLSQSQALQHGVKEYMKNIGTHEVGGFSK